jgi:hypothetical protein
LDFLEELKETKKRPHFWGRNQKRRVGRKLRCKAPLPLKKQLGSRGREQEKKRIELIGYVASFL